RPPPVRGASALQGLAIVTILIANAIETSAPQTQIGPMLAPFGLVRDLPRRGRPARLSRRSACAVRRALKWPKKSARAPSRPHFPQRASGARGSRLWAGPPLPTLCVEGMSEGGSQEEKMREAKFSIGQVVRHKLFPFRGVVFDVDPEFSNTEEWLTAIPEPIRPRRDQPFYHLFAENDDSSYIAYVSEQNLVPDDTGDPIEHPQIDLMFDETDEGGYKLRPEVIN